MKLTAILFLAVALFIGAPALSQQVSIAGKDLRLEEVFAEIKKQTGFEFLYQGALLKDARPVTLNVLQTPIAEVLKRCLEGQGLGFNIRSGTVIIFKQEEPINTQEPLKVPPDTAIYIRGQVVDFRGQPVEMATIMLARTNNGTLTNREGIFTLKLKEVQTTDVINISFVGLKSETIRLNGKTSLGQVVLQEAGTPLDETVVIAYGTTSERFRTGDISKIKAADIEKTPALNIVEALAGRIPGLYVRQKGSNPGSMYSVQLRGVNVLPPTSAMAFSEAAEVLSKPLIVLDGLPLAPDVVNELGQYLGTDAMTGLSGAGGGQDPLYWLNALDVESLTVLKDAEATALYGSRAANGVILITTKKGKAGKTALNITFNTGINAQAKRLKLLNTQQYLAMRREAWANTIQAGIPVISGAGVSYTPNPANSYDLLVWDTTRHTDWQKELLGNAPVYNAGIALSGGEGNTAWRLTAGYNNVRSSYPHLSTKPAFKDEKGTLSLSISTYSPNNRLKLTTSVMASTLASNQPVISPEDYIFLAPNAPAIFDEAGNFNYVPWRPVSPFPTLLTGHPLSLLAAHYHGNRFTMFARNSVSYELVPSLVFKIGTGYSRSDGKQLMTLPAIAFDPISRLLQRQAAFGNSNSIGFNIEPNLHYEARWGRHHFDVLTGVSYQYDKQTGDIIYASGFTSDELMGTPDAAPIINSYTNSLYRKSVSALSRIAYRYADIYLIDLSARRDGSSSFGPGRRFGNFGSIGLGWIFTKEAWFRNIPLLTFGKIRGSYGITGSQSANPYAYLSTFRQAITTSGSLPGLVGLDNNGIYQGIPALALTRIANPIFGWAQAVSLDFGMDLYLLEDQRLKLTMQWYRKRTGRQLVTKPVSLVTGTHEYFANIPAKVENTGWETIIEYASPKWNTAVSWYTHLNIAANRNKLLAYPGLENSPVKNFYEVGKSLVWKDLYPTFLNKATGTYSPVDSLHPSPTSYKVANYPAFTGGLQVGISWKGLSLSLSCTFATQKGFTNMQGTAYPGVLETFAISNQSKEVIQNRRWQSPADSTIGGAFHAGENSITNLDVYWGNASYIALKNATLSYDLPQRLLRKAGIGNLNLYIRSENLLMLPLSGYKGANPEYPGLEEQMPLRMLLVGGFTMNL